MDLENVKVAVEYTSSPTSGLLAVKVLALISAVVAGYLAHVNQRTELWGVFHVLLAATWAVAALESLLTGNLVAMGLQLLAAAVPIWFAAVFARAAHPA